MSMFAMTRQVAPDSIWSGWRSPVRPAAEMKHFKRSSMLPMLPRDGTGTSLQAWAARGVAPILVGQAVVVLLAEVSETDRDPNTFQRAAFEVGVHREHWGSGFQPEWSNVQPLHVAYV
jgi:hypothetical protein